MNADSTLMTPIEEAAERTMTWYITYFDAENQGEIAALFDPHYGRLSFEGSVYPDRQAIYSLYWGIFYYHANQEQHAKLSLQPDSPPVETGNIFIEKGEGKVRAYTQIRAQIENKTVAVDIMAAEWTFPFKIFFSNQVRLNASGRVYLPILHLIVPVSTLTGNMTIKSAA